MSKKWTKRASNVVFCSQEEASRLGHRKVNTEHLLLGMFRDIDDSNTASADGMTWPPAPSAWRGIDNVAIRVLREIGADVHALRVEAEQKALRGKDAIGVDMELSADSRRVMDLCYEESQRLQNNYIGTEHLLLGLIREEKGIAGRIFAQQGITLQQMRDAVARVQNSPQD